MVGLVLLWLTVILEIAGLALDTAWHQNDPGPEPLGRMLLAHAPIYLAVLAQLALGVGLLAGERRARYGVPALALLIAMAVLRAGPLLFDLVTESTGFSTDPEAFVYLAGLLGSLVAALVVTVVFVARAAR